MQRIAAQSMVGMLMAGSFAMAAFAQNVPPVTLPATTLPEVTVAQPALPNVPATPAPAKTALNGVLDEIARNAEPVNPAPTKTYSYGASPLSVLFLPVQTDRMRKAIRTYEDAGHSATTFVAPEPVSITAAPADVINEPPSYPVFYLASIAYDAPGSWSLWVSGHKITSRKNDTDLTVLRVSPDSVTFSWSPTYMLAINQRRNQKQFAPVDPVKNRLLASQQINVNEKTNAVTFTLHPNQSFTVGYFRMFEGFVAAPSMPVITAAAGGVTDNSLANTVETNPFIQPTEPTNAQPAPAQAPVRINRGAPQQSIAP